MKKLLLILILGCYSCGDSKATNEKIHLEMLQDIRYEQSRLQGELDVLKEVSGETNDYETLLFLYKKSNSLEKEYDDLMKRYDSIDIIYR